MKKNLIITFMLIILGSFCFVKCSKEETRKKGPELLLNLDTLTLEHSMKGWELYSWQNGNNWKYSILEGTNRMKTYEEVIGSDIIVGGTDSLKMLLDRLPVYEEIFWIGEEWLDRIWNGNSANLGLPDSITINEIEFYCSQNKLVLSITN